MTAWVGFFDWGRSGNIDSLFTIRLFCPFVQGLPPASAIIYFMDKRPLIETNPYLRDPKKFRKALITNVSSSSSIETGTPAESIARTLTESETTQLVKKPQGSAR